MYCSIVLLDSEPHNAHTVLQLLVVEGDVVDHAVRLKTNTIVENLWGEGIASRDLLQGLQKYDTIISTE